MASLCTHTHSHERDMCVWDARCLSLLQSRYLYMCIFLYGYTDIYVHVAVERKSMQTTFGNLVAVQLFSLFPVSYSHLFVSFLLQIAFYCCIWFVLWTKKRWRYMACHTHTPMHTNTHTHTYSLRHLALALKFCIWDSLFRMHWKKFKYLFIYKTLVFYISDL